MLIQIYKIKISFTCLHDAIVTKTLMCLIFIYINNFSLMNQFDYVLLAIRVGVLLLLNERLKNSRHHWKLNLLYSYFIVVCRALILISYVFVYSDIIYTWVHLCKFKHYLMHFCCTFSHSAFSFYLKSYFHHYNNQTASSLELVFELTFSCFQYLLRSHVCSFGSSFYIVKMSSSFFTCNSLSCSCFLFLP